MTTVVESIVPLLTRIRASKAGITTLAESDDADGQTITCYDNRDQEVAYLYRPPGSPFWYARRIFEDPQTFEDVDAAMAHVINGPPYTDQPGYLCSAKSSRR